MMIMVVTTRPCTFLIYLLVHLLQLTTYLHLKQLDHNSSKNGEKKVMFSFLIVPQFYQMDMLFWPCKDKEYIDPHKAYEQPANNSKSPKQRLEFLLNLKQALCNQHGTKFIKGIKGVNTQNDVFFTMRINIVKGAFTVSHTDVLRNSLLPNYCIFYCSDPQEQQSNFALKIKKFPRFKTSIVKWKGRMLIPFDYNEGPKDEPFNYESGHCGYLKMIG